MRDDNGLPTISTPHGTIIFFCPNCATKYHVLMRDRSISLMLFDVRRYAEGVVGAAIVDRADYSCPHCGYAIIIPQYIHPN